MGQNIQHTVASTFASRTSTDQSLQKSFHLSHADKIEFKKNSYPSENKKYATTKPDTTKTVKRFIDNGFQGRTTQTTGYNSTYPKSGAFKAGQAVFQKQFCDQIKHLFFKSFR